MHVTVRYFAIMRERMGIAVEQRPLPDDTTAGEVFRLVTADYPELSGLERSVMVMVNETYADRDQLIRDGDDIALIPPVSGGDHTPLFKVTEDVLEPRIVEQLVAGDDAGAIVTFTGTVRNVARGRTVHALEYEAYPAAAEKMLEQVAFEASEQWPDVRMACWHRYGRLLPGEASVVIVTSSPHRDAAYAASAFAISRMKEIVPIWKKEFYDDGETWIGSEHDYQIETGRLQSPESA